MSNPRASLRSRTVLKALENQCHYLVVMHPALRLGPVRVYATLATLDLAVSVRNRALLHVSYLDNTRHNVWGTIIQSSDAPLVRALTANCTAFIIILARR